MKKIAIFVCMLMIASIVFPMKIVESMEDPNEHLISLFPPWDWHDDYSEYGGVSDSDYDYGYAQADTDEGNGYAWYDHYITWDCNAEDVNVYISIYYVYNYVINLESVHSYANLWFYYYLKCDGETIELEINKFIDNWNGYYEGEEHDVNIGLHLDDIPFQKGKSYDIGVKTYVAVKGDDAYLKAWNDFKNSDPDDETKIVLTWTNRKPNKPDKPSGKTYGKTGTPYPYNTSATDPDNDKLAYGWDWDGDEVVDQPWDDNNGNYYASGELISTSHEWPVDGTYDIRVKAKDIYGAESVWSDKLTVTMPKNTGCVQGTQITMPSGIGPITKPIEDIGVGEFILSYNPILQVTTAAEVIEVCIYTEDLPDHNLIFNGNLEVTPSHTLYINGIGWMEAENAQMGYYMLGNIPDTPDIYPVVISSKEPTGPASPIYDLVIQPLAGEAIGYWADGILVGGYN